MRESPEGKAWAKKIWKLSEQMEKKGLKEEAKQLRDLTEEVRQNGSSWYSVR